MKTFFCNRTVDKGEMKRLIKWVLLNYGTEKTTRLIDQLKTMGFHYCLLYTSPSPRDQRGSRMPSSA